MSKQKLLLADDSVTIQKVVNLTFADEGIEVISVGDGDSAMEKILETSPDLIMVDVNMPGLNGYEICEKLRNSQTFRHTPVILLVGSFEPFDEDEAKRVGADDYLTKPFQSIRQLVQKVTNLLAAERNNGLAAAEQTEVLATVDEIPEILPPAEAKFEDTLEDYSIQTEKDEFGDVTNDDEMIQTNRFPAFTDTETSDDESELTHKNSFEEKEIETEQIGQETEPTPYKPIEHDAEIEEPKPYIPVEHSDEPKPYIPIEHDTEIEEPKPYIPIEHGEEPKPYIPIEHNAEIEEPKAYTPIEHDLEPIDSEPQVAHNTAVSDLKEVISDKPESSPELNDVSLPEMASILTLDEQNPLEIAPREEDFIIDMDHEQNISADWDFIETRSFTNAQSDVSEQLVKQFEIIPEIAEPKVEESVQENSQVKTTEPENTDSQTPPVEKIESDELNSFNEVENTEPTDAVTAEPEAVKEELEKNVEPASAETAVVETNESEIENAGQTAENNISVPNFIASTVVSEVAKEKVAISEELIEVIVNRVMERLSDNVVREIAWEIVPSHTDIIIKKMVQEKLDKD